ncbi:MAG: beta-lactamase family protein [Deltaproteobacteria bacterium]|nr:beta-lactamase family protein [Deltaproteobacteria bacterium]MBW2363242.1 beta-lactamase family protein [Deltaproteobacteria bacterium]
MQAYVDEEKLAGLVTLIARRGKVAHFEAFGMQDREAARPMQRDTLFRIYSMTKPITSVAVLILFERGHFLLHDPITKYIPELEGLRVIEDPAGPLDRTRPLERAISIRDLLVHTSGFSYDWILPAGPLADAYGELTPKRRAGDLRSFIRHLAELPLAYPPATRWNYGMSTDVLGHLVAVVSGVPLDVFLREQIFEPLGMLDTDFHVPREKIERFAANYAPGPDGGLRLIDAPAESRFVARPPSFFEGGGGLVSTVSDYARFAQMLLNRGELEGRRILGPKTVELMTQNHLSEQELQADFLKTAFSGWGFGLGVSVVTDIARTQLPGSNGEYGWNGAAGTTFWVDPGEELIAIQMTQLMPFARYALPSALRALVYPALVD